MVRCADCGFLAVSDPRTRQLVEVGPDGRERWELPATPFRFETVAAGLSPSSPVTGRIPLYPGTPICAAGAMPIDREAGSDKPDAVLPVICGDRPCLGFVRWRRDLSPKEHHQMWMAEQMQQFQADQNRRARRQGSWNVLLGGAIGLVGVMLGKLIAAPAPPPVVNVPPQSPPNVIVQPPTVVVNVPKDAKGP